MKENEIEICTVAPGIKLIDLGAAIAGYRGFLGAYLLCGDKRAIVDVGPRATIPSLLSGLAQIDVGLSSIDYIILSHIHIDHAGGVGTALKEMNKAKVVAHSRARSHLIDPARLWEASLQTLGDMAIEYGDIEPVPEDRIVVAQDLMKLDLGQGMVLEIYLTPGHAAHHLSLFNRAHSVLIAGETAGVCIGGTIRPATPPPFKLEETLSSIDRLIALKPEKLCYGHFGCYDDAVDRLQLVRSKILEWHEIVNSAAKAGNDAEKILSMLREGDKDLEYLNGLDRDEYERENKLLINDIYGLCGSLQDRT